MSARQRSMMKLCGMALCSLAVFTFCCVGGSTSSELFPTPSNISTTTARQPNTTTVASNSSTMTRSLPTSTNATDAKESTTTPVPTTSVKTTVTASGPKGSPITPSETTHSGKSESSPPPLGSATRTPSLTSAAADQTSCTTTKNHVKGYDTKSKEEYTSQNPTGTKAATENNNGKPDSGSQAQEENPSYSSIILPVVIALIVITLSVFLLVALYRMCWKTTPERQENGTEQAPSEKENVKLISVKTTSLETGEHSSQGKNKTRLHDDSTSRLGSKCV